MANLTLPEYSWILIDTNFLIDFYSKQTNYVKIIEEFRHANCTLISTDFVKTEFIRSKTKEVLNAKTEFFDKLIESTLPIDQEVIKLIKPTLEKYGQDCDHLSLTDIYLAVFIQRYSKVYLLTRNHADFPTRLFSRKYIFNIESEKDVKAYALYQYKSPEATKIETEIEVISF